MFARLPLGAPAQHAFNVREQGEVMTLLIVGLAPDRWNAYDPDACHVHAPLERDGSRRRHQVFHTRIVLTSQGKRETSSAVVQHRFLSLLGYQVLGGISEMIHTSTHVCQE